MKRSITSWFLTASHCALLCLAMLEARASVSAIEYSLEPVINKPSTYLRVNVTLHGDFDHGVQLTLPSFWGGVDYRRQIQNIRSDKGIKLKRNKKHRLRLTGTHVVSFHYEVHSKAGDPSNVHNAIIRPDLMHSPGYGLFAIPLEMDGDKKIPIKITWRSLPAYFHAASSHGTGTSYAFDGNADMIRHALYLAGNVRLEQLGSKKSPLFVALYGDFDFRDRQLFQGLLEITQTQRSFFNDDDFPYYLVSVIGGAQGNSIGGTALNNCFTAYLNRKSRYLDFYTLFAHEHFHNWLGIKIALDEKTEKSDYWFSEGFTEYYSRVLALRSGGLSVEAFAKEMNILLQDYFLSPYINASNQLIDKKFWQDYTIQKVPYGRGLALAFYLNAATQSHDDAASLDDLLVDLYRLSKQAGFVFRTDVFLKLLKPCVPRANYQTARSVIESGQSVPFEAVAHELGMVKKPLGRFYMGFDSDAFFKLHQIEGLDKRSNGYKAGLREGDKINVILTARRSCFELLTPRGKIKFKPEHYDKKLVWQFKTPLNPEDIQRIKRFF